MLNSGNGKGSTLSSAETFFIFLLTSVVQNIKFIIMRKNLAIISLVLGSIAALVGIGVAVVILLKKGRTG
jgi:hypothetical protein